VVVSGDGELRRPVGSSPLLGAFDDARFSDQEVPVSPGDTVLLYTDGVTDTPGSEERFGFTRLQTLVREHAQDSPAEVLAALSAAIERFQSGDHNDDIAALALRVGS
jgi:serine phosphatase RsbU (regulator of sigma subunit)